MCLSDLYGRIRAPSGFVYEITPRTPTFTVSIQICYVNGILSVYIPLVFRGFIKSMLLSKCSLSEILRYLTKNGSSYEDAIDQIRDYEGCIKTDLKSS